MYLYLNNKYTFMYMYMFLSTQIQHVYLYICRPPTSAYCQIYLIYLSYLFFLLGKYVASFIDIYIQCTFLHKIVPLYYWL